ncbi:MAG: DMT family transporter [Collinsella sp.]
MIEEQVAKTAAGIEENDPFASKDAVPVPPEDRAPGNLRGAGARSPLFWKLMLVAMALIWGYSFLTMKTVLDTVPTFMLLACRFLLSAVIMFIIFRKRIKAHFNREYLGFGVLMGCVIWSAYAAQTLGLVDTTPGKNAFLTGTYCILVPFIALILFQRARHQVAYRLCAAVPGGRGLRRARQLQHPDGRPHDARGRRVLRRGHGGCGPYRPHARRQRPDLVDVPVRGPVLACGDYRLRAPRPRQAVDAARLSVSSCSSPWCAPPSACCCRIRRSRTCRRRLARCCSRSRAPRACCSPSCMAGEVLTGKLIFGFVLIFLSIVLSETHFSFLRKWFPKK